MKTLLALFFTLILLSSPVLAVGTIDIWGTNASNAQTNATVKLTNATVTVSAWAIGDTTKTFKVNVTVNASDELTFNISNLTVGRVMEVRHNGSSYNAYQADSAGNISFTLTQKRGNWTYQIAPAVNVGGNNFTWAWFWNALNNLSLPSLAYKRTENIVYSKNSSNLSVIKIGGDNNGSYELDLVVNVGSSTNTTSTSGQYEGDGTTNRAIAHGLGKKPKSVMATVHNCMTSVWMLTNADNSTNNVWVNSSAGQIVTAADSTNFYVSPEGANAIATAKCFFKWTAVG